MIKAGILSEILSDGYSLFCCIFTLHQRLDYASNFFDWIFHLDLLNRCWKTTSEVLIRVEDWHLDSFRDSEQTARLCHVFWQQLHGGFKIRARLSFGELDQNINGLDGHWPSLVLMLLIRLTPLSIDHSPSPHLISPLLFFQASKGHALI